MDGRAVDVAVGGVEGEELVGDVGEEAGAGALEEMPALGRVGGQERAEVFDGPVGGDGGGYGGLGRNVGLVGEGAVLADGVLEERPDLDAEGVERPGEGVGRLRRRG